MSGFLGDDNSQISTGGFLSPPPSPAPAAPTNSSNSNSNGGAKLDLDAILQDEGTERVKPVLQAILSQESGNNPNVKNSIDGARGMAQIIPATWKQYAEDDEDPHDPEDNVRVASRILNDLYQKSGGDPAKMAAGYFSGSGNIGTNTPYKVNSADGNGKTVASYVNDVLTRMGQRPTASPAAQQGSPANAPIGADFQNKPQANQQGGQGAAPLPSLSSDAPTWAAVSARPAFQSLTPAEQSLARAEYFNKWVAPTIPQDQIPAAKAAFIQQSQGADAKPPGMLESAWNSVKNAASNAIPAYMKQGFQPAPSTSGSRFDDAMSTYGSDTMPADITPTDAGNAASAFGNSMAKSFASTGDAISHAGLMADTLRNYALARLGLSNPVTDWSLRQDKAAADASSNAVDTYNQNLAALPQTLGNKVAAGVGGLAGDIPQIMATGGGAETKYAWDIAKYAAAQGMKKEAIAILAKGGAELGGQAIKSMSPVAIPAAYERYKDLIAQGVDPETASKAAAVTYATSTAMGAIPMGFSGSLPVRAASGATVGMAMNAGSTAIDNQVLSDYPKLQQDPLAADNLIAGAITGGVMHGALGHGEQGKVTVTRTGQQTMPAPDFKGTTIDAATGRPVDEKAPPGSPNNRVEPTMPPEDSFSSVLTPEQQAVDNQARAAFSDDTPKTAEPAPQESQPAPAPSNVPDGHDQLAAYLNNVQHGFMEAYHAGDAAKFDALRANLRENLTPLLGQEKTADYITHLIDDGGIRDAAGISHPYFNEAGNALDAMNRPSEAPEASKPEAPEQPPQQAQKQTTPAPIEASQEKPAADPTPGAHMAGGLPIHELPVSALMLSNEVPQFKLGADTKGVVDPLGGKFDRTGVAPIQVWKRNNGNLEVISGRHRLDLAQRSGEATIPSQVHSEADGFTAKHAAALDATLNIRDGQGKVRDYVDFFKDSAISREDADAAGLLARSTGQRAYRIANDGSDALIAAHRSGIVSDEGAHSIASAAPRDERLQSLGVKAIQDGISIKDSVNLMHAVKSMSDGRDNTSGDMFGFDDSAMRQAEEMAKIASRKQREISERVTAISNAAKNPKVAKAEGVDVKDPRAVMQRVTELKDLKAKWDNWPTNSDLVDEIRADMAPKTPEAAPLELKGETPADLKIKEAKTEKAKAQARKEKAAQEAKERADADAKEIAARQEASAENFKLGESADDSLSGQKDIFAEPEDKAAEAPTQNREKDADTQPQGDEKTLDSQATEPSDADLGDMFDSLMDEQKASEAKPKTEKAARAKREAKAKVKKTGEVKERAAGEAAVSAAKNTGKGLADAVDGLGKLFGGNSTLGSGPVFNEETYAKAKPLFQQAVEHFKDAWTDIKDVMRAVIKAVSDKFGSDTAAKMKDYIVRFISDFRKEQSESASSQHIEQDRGNDVAKNSVGENAVSNESEAARPADTGTERSVTRERDAARAGVAVSEPGAAVSGEGRYNGVSRQNGEFGPGSHDGESLHAEGSSVDSRPGDAVDRAAEERVAEDDAARDVVLQLSRAERLAKQKEANNLPVKLGDKASIDATLPLLLDGQRADVHFAEKRLMKPDGHGVLFANGTGTGKTYLGLGIVKRLIGAGKGNGTIVVPDEDVMKEWLNSAPNLGIELKKLRDTKDQGRGVSITTYANFGDNDTLLDRSHDFLLTDEAHRLMSNSDAQETKALETARAITYHPDSAHRRTEMLHRDLVAQIKALRDRQSNIPKDAEGNMTAANRARSEAIDAELEPLQKSYQNMLSFQRNVVSTIKGEDRPRLIALSATPFAWEPNIQWAHGFLFDYPKASQRGGYNTPNPYQQYMIQHFGYRMRYNRLTKPDAKVDRSLMQMQYNKHLREQGVLSTRMLDVERDYDRKFVLVDGGIGARIDSAMQWLREHKDGLYSGFHEDVRKKFDYLTQRRLLEAIKANAVVPIIKQHHALGRKVVVFHDYNQGGGFAPFDFKGDRNEIIKGTVRSGMESRQVEFKRGAFLDEFSKEFPELIGNDLAKLKSPIETLRAAFPNALFNNGLEPKAKARNAIAAFNDDSKPENNLLVVQSAKNAGWGGHDQTGRHMRVNINLGLPTAPVQAIQLEGRTYRTGVMTDAPMRYLNTGTMFERMAFAHNISDRASTAENLAMGDFARGLRKSFVDAFQASDTYPPGPDDGKGGKEMDRRDNTMTDFDKAKSYYYGQQKKTSATKAAEGKDYFATPEPVGYKMAQWLHAKAGEDVLEPSAGHGAIARWFPEDVNRKSIEPSTELASRLSLVTDPKGVINGKFEDHHISNKYDGIAMNPPFGSSGKTAMEHVAKAFEHLKDGGRIVAIIPSSPSMDKRFHEWLTGSSVNGRGDVKLNNPDAHLVTYVNLPGSTFERAGTSVPTRIVVIDKNKGKNDGTGLPTHPASAKAARHEVDIGELFDYIKDMDMPPRDVPAEKAAAEAATPAKDGNGVQVHEHGRVIDDASKAVFNIVGDKLQTDAPIAKVQTAAGKVLDGVYVKDKATAFAVDKFTWKPKGQDAYFVRMRHVVRPPADEAHSIEDLTAKRLRGEISSAEYVEQAKAMATMPQNSSDVRGAIETAAKHGHIGQKEADLATFFLDKNPALATSLKLSVRPDDGSHSAGTYNNVKRLVTLFAKKTAVSTAVHEILHHTERMMPPEVRDGIVNAWHAAWKEAYQAGDDKVKAALENIMVHNRGEANTYDQTTKDFADGTLNVDDHYDLVNPSEYWAVHGADMLHQRFDAEREGWKGQAKQWLKELGEHVKAFAGKNSDSAVLNGLKSVYSADGRFKAADMLHNIRFEDESRSLAMQREEANAWNPQKLRALSPMKAMESLRDGYSPYVGIETKKLPSTPVGDSIKKVFAPASRGSIASETAGIVRANLGIQAREREVAMTNLQKTAAMFDKLPVSDSYQFIHRMERGLPQPDAKLQDAADALRTLLDERRDQVIALGKGQLENFYENYFPHIWEQKRTAGSFFSKRSMEGSKDFLKQRSHEFFSDGLAAGLTPVTTNPVELTLLKAREMDRYIYGQKIFNEMKMAGLAKFVKFGQKAPDGSIKLNDKIAKVFSRTSEGMVIRGEYYAPEAAGTLINNHLSPGLKGNGFFDAWRAIGSAMNSMQLGLSAFHLGFTTMDVMVSKAALGVKQFSRGDFIQGTGNVVQGLNPAQPFMNLYKGDKLMRAYLGKLQDPDMAPIVEALMQGGGRVKMDDFYRNTTVNGFKQALRKAQAAQIGGNYSQAAKQYGKALVKMLPHTLDLLSKPIFEYLVPRQKLGVFFDMAKDALEKNPNMTIQEKRRVMGKLWDSVDNRMGEMVYDNLFWHNALKDGLMASVRSVGWNTGTFRELGGGVKDIRHVIGESDTNPGKKEWKGFTDRTAYLLALPLIAGVMGSILGYMYTGQGPSDMKDAFFPRTGKVRPDGSQDRVSMPTYVKDVYEYGHDIHGAAKYATDPTRTLRNKVHPLVATIGQFLSNEDFYGEKIRSPGDDGMQQAADVATFLLKDILPFSVRNFQQQKKTDGKNGSILGYVASPQFFGLGSAPGYITKSDEQLESEEVARQAPGLERKFRQEFKEDDDKGEVIRRMYKAGLSDAQVKHVIKTSGDIPAPKAPRSFGGQN